MCVERDADADDGGRLGLEEGKADSSRLRSKLQLRLGALLPRHSLDR